MNLLPHLAGWVVKGCWRRIAPKGLGLWIAVAGVSLRNLSLADMKSESASSVEMQRLGLTLRALRIKRKWTLKDFENACGSQIKDVVLGTYERGSRSISVGKLILIASVYEVPVSIFFTENRSLGALESPNQLTIDIRKLREVTETRYPDTISMLNKFVMGIIDIRRDWNGEILSLRKSDLTQLAILSSQSVELIIEEFRLLNLLFNFKG